MATAAKPLSKPLSMSNAFLLPPSPAIFAGKSLQHISLPLKPIKLHLSASFKSNPLRRNPNFSRIITFVSPQEEDNTLVLQQHETEVETETGVSGWSSVEGTVEESGGGETEEYSEPPEEAKIFVGNLPYDVDSEQLAQLFQQAGVVEISEVIYNRETDQSRGFGFVTMSTVEEAEKAGEMLHRYVFRFGNTYRGEYINYLHSMRLGKNLYPRNHINTPSSNAIKKESSFSGSPYQQ